ncbi:MAG: hypothetical protein Q9187_004462 [Circinaria calcarea]
MRSSLFILSASLLSICSYALPVQNTGIEGVESLTQRDNRLVDTFSKRVTKTGEDADEAIAYAWFTEEQTSTRKRSLAAQEDADEAIAYAWFTEEPASTRKRSAEAEEDADEAIAYAWFTDEPTI